MNSASARASSVLPTPVGPRNRNVPIGRSGSLRPARERRSALATASTASSWPTTRWCRRSSMWTSFSTSPSMRRRDRDAGPAATTSAMSSASTSSWRKPALAVGSRGLGLGELALELGDLAVAQLGGALQVGFALGALGLAVRLLEALLDLAGRRRWRPSRPATAAFIAAALLAQLGELALDRLAALGGRVVLLLRQRRALDLELHDAALDLVDLGRAASRSRCAARDAASSTRSIALSGRKRSAM